VAIVTQTLVLLVSQTNIFAASQLLSMVTSLACVAWLLGSLVLCLCLCLCVFVYVCVFLSVSVCVEKTNVYKEKPKNTKENHTQTLGKTKEQPNILWKKQKLKGKTKKDSRKQKTTRNNQRQTKHTLEKQKKHKGNTTKYIKHKKTVGKTKKHQKHNKKHKSE
jgi:hypothetical protein